MQANKNTDIVFWAFPSWNGNYMKSTVELAKELAVRNRVLYIDYGYTIKDILTAKENSQIPVKRIIGLQSSLQKVELGNGGQIYLLSLPPLVPFNWTNNPSIFSFIEKVNTVLAAARIKKALAQLGFNPQFVVNAFNPFFAAAAKRVFKNCKLVYYCYDNMEATVWAAKHGARLEKEIIANADAVIFSSDALKINKPGNAKAFVVKNGVDLRIFENANFKVTQPDTKKIIGYTGCIDDRLDYQLLYQVIFANPQLLFQFIGPVTAKNIDLIKSLPNVQLLGAVSPVNLPAAMRGFSVGIIPFVKNDFTSTIYPMKANEYLALGIPVVATGFAQLNDLSSYITVADQAIDFSKAINSALENDNSQKQHERKLKAKLNSWEQKSIEFENILWNHVA